MSVVMVPALACPDALWTLRSLRRLPGDGKTQQGLSQDRGWIDDLQLMNLVIESSRSLKLMNYFDRFGKCMEMSSIIQLVLLSFQELWTDHQDYSCASNLCKQQWRFDLPGNHPGHSWEMHLTEHAITFDDKKTILEFPLVFEALHWNELHVRQQVVLPTGGIQYGPASQCQAFFQGEDLHPSKGSIYICMGYQCISYGMQSHSSVLLRLKQMQLSVVWSIYFI